MVERPPETVLVVDDDDGLLRLIERALRREGFIAATAQSGRQAMEWLEGNRADLMLLDLKLEDAEGPELVARLTNADRCPPFIIITGQGDERVAVDMMKRGARDYLVKDVDFLQFVPAVVKRALDQLNNERRLAEAEEQVRLVRGVIEQGFSAVLIVSAESPDPKVVFANPAFAEATGYVAREIIGKPLSSLRGLSHVAEKLRADFPSNTLFLEEISAYHTRQGERWGEWRLGPVKNNSGQTTHWLIIFRDITEHRRLEREVLEISDREQRRIGQDLHDGLCQHLAGIELMSQVLQQKLAGRNKAAAARAEDIGKNVREAISQTRSLARGLAPVTLESEGLAAALRELASNAEMFFGIDCKIECGQDPIGIEPAVATHLYRIAQEALSNAVKHGNASRVVIDLRTDPDRLLLSITDNGKGFPTEVASSGGMGLRIMRYRAGIIGGTLSTQSGAGGGAVISCEVPTRTRPESKPAEAPLPSAE
ncbi:MAG TPA: response regulator [Verrucomicrobiae bacterium]|nr:response regulator [Verrucomicrobiae bacterium]